MIGTSDSWSMIHLYHRPSNILQIDGFQNDAFFTAGMAAEKNKHNFGRHDKQIIGPSYFVTALDRQTLAWVTKLDELQLEQPNDRLA